MEISTGGAEERCTSWLRVNLRLSVV